MPCWVLVTSRTTVQNLPKWYLLYYRSLSLSAMRPWDLRGTLVLPVCHLQCWYVGGFWSAVFSMFVWHILCSWSQRVHSVHQWRLLRARSCNLRLLQQLTIARRIQNLLIHHHHSSLYAAKRLCRDAAATVRLHLSHSREQLLRNRSFFLSDGATNSRTLCITYACSF